MSGPTTQPKAMLVREVPGLEQLIGRIGDADAEILLDLMVAARTSLDADIDLAVDRGLQLLPALLRRPVRKVIGR